MAQSDPPKSYRDRYVMHAAKLRAMAEAAQSDDIKQEFLVLAQQYETLADDVTWARHQPRT